MTPAINLAKKLNITHTVHEYRHESNAESYGLEAVEKLNIDSSRVFKTLVVQLDGKELAVGIVPVTAKLSMKLMAKASQAKKAVMAEPAAVEKSTGYVLGGVSPLGQKKRLKTYIDNSAEGFESIYVSAGKRGLEIELGPTDLASATKGHFADLKQV